MCIVYLIKDLYPNIYKELLQRSKDTNNPNK